MMLPGFTNTKDGRNAERRYLNDAGYRALVDSLEAWIDPTGGDAGRDPNVIIQAAQLAVEHTIARGWPR